MLTTTLLAVDTDFFRDLRRREFARLDRAGVAYLDYTGSALHADSQRRAYDRLLEDGVFGNPHSAHAASTASARVIEAARARIRAMLDAGDEYVVCFTANTSGAVRLVAEAYPFGPDVPLVLSADNHNSVNGVREYARRCGAAVEHLPLNRDLMLHDAPQLLARVARSGGLLAYPAQSNFSGVRHPLSLISTAQRLGLRVLVDAAAYLPASSLSLQTHPADFVVLSFYKLFGLPTGLGALVARRDALKGLTRPWFAGGTVDYASVALQRHQLQHGEAAFEDGTPHFLGIAALGSGFELREQIGIDRTHAHVRALTAMLIDGLRTLAHSNGSPLVRVYGPPELSMRGGTVTFNVLSAEGRVLPYEWVETRANAERVFLRGGCFCNPGAAEAAFEFDADALATALDGLRDGFSIPALRSSLRGTAVGALRASVGIANTPADIDRALAVVESFGRQ
jgi:selenocysteine lyase/cysteine desulfurase